MIEWAYMLVIVYHVKACTDDMLSCEDQTQYMVVQADDRVQCERASAILHRKLDTVNSSVDTVCAIPASRYDGRATN